MKKKEEVSPVYEYEAEVHGQKVTVKVYNAGGKYFNRFTDMCSAMPLSSDGLVKLLKY